MSSENPTNSLKKGDLGSLAEFYKENSKIFDIVLSSMSEIFLDELVAQFLY